MDPNEKLISDFLTKYLMSYMGTDEDTSVLFYYINWEVKQTSLGAILVFRK